MGELPPNVLGGDSGAGTWQGIKAVGKGGSPHSDDILRGVLQLGWRTPDSDEEVRREKQSSSTFDHQHVSLVVQLKCQQSVFQFKFVTENILLHLYQLRRSY